MSIDTMKIETMFGESTNMILECRFAEGAHVVPLLRALEGGRCLVQDLSYRQAAQWLKMQGLVVAPESIERFERSGKFENLLDLEFELQGARASVQCQLAGVPPYRMQQMREAAKRAQAALFAALEALTDEEKVAYGPYRAKVHAEITKRSS
jgi:hypothetical protein